jgi:phenylacetate-CoA ligase
MVTASTRGERVAKMVTWAAREIPFYRDRFAGLGERVASEQDLGLLPIMTKRDIRENFPARLLPDGADFATLVDQGEAVVHTTSGTGAERLAVVVDAKRWTAPFRNPGFDRIEGGLRELRIAIFTTPICSGAICHMGAMSYEERLVGRQLVLNSSDRVMHLSRAELETIVEDLARFRPTILQVDPVYGVALVRALQKHGLPLPQVAAIRSTYEYCSVIHRQILEEVLDAPVFCVYGAAELGGGTAALACDHGRYHVWDDEFVFELVDGNRSVGEGELGALVITSTHNRFMPVIRYRVGDLGRPTPCTCAFRAWPAFDLEGRERDCMVDREGRLITTRAVDELFRDLHWLDFYQLAQLSLDEYELQAVRREVADVADEERFLERARGLFGERAKISVRYVREISAQKSLKYRLTLSQIAPVE